MADTKKIDPFDVEALEKSLNDSATRVSTIWVSFLIFSLYLLTAATTVTHRQLFLAEPVKLPVLNIDLPLWGFFWLAPILFVIFHAYVLIQLILLARTAAAYDWAVTKLAEQNDLSPEANASLRQRLANTLFAQILAGSPREREGWFGLLLKAMAWITLVIAPVLILLTFQFMFLPYHSHLATWTHRLLILLEFVVAFQLWPLVLNPQRDFQWPDWRRLIRETAIGMTGLFGSSEGRQRARQRLRQQAAPLAATALFILLSLSLATFPGEPHVNLFTGQAIDGVQCRRWIQQKFDFADIRFDRLNLPSLHVVDDEKLAKIVEATSKRSLPDYEGERSRDFQWRDLNCSELISADLRRVDLSHARLIGALLYSASLQGASLGEAHLHAAILKDAQLQGAYLLNVNLRGANLEGAQLQGAFLFAADLQDASLSYAKLQGANLVASQLQGAEFGDAELQGVILVAANLDGADLNGAKLRGANLSFATLQGASLRYSQLHGADLHRATLRGANLNDVELQGAFLSGVDLAGSQISNARVWRAKNAACANTHVDNHKSDAILKDKSLLEGEEEVIPASPNHIAKFIERSVADIPAAHSKKAASERMRAGLVVDATKDDTQEIAQVWMDCEVAAAKIPKEVFDKEHAVLLRNLVCDTTESQAAVARGVVRNWISSDLERGYFSAQLASGLLGQDGKKCAATDDLDTPIKQKLQAAVAATSGPPPATAPLPKKP